MDFNKFSSKLNELRAQGLEFTKDNIKDLDNPDLDLYLEYQRKAKIVRNALVKLPPVANAAPVNEDIVFTDTEVSVITNSSQIDDKVNHSQLLVKYPNHIIRFNKIKNIVLLTERLSRKENRVRSNCSNKITLTTKDLNDSLVAAILADINENFVSAKHHGLYDSKLTLSEYAVVNNFSTKTESIVSAPQVNTEVAIVLPATKLGIKFAKNEPGIGWNDIHIPFHDKSNKEKGDIGEGSYSKIYPFHWENSVKEKYKKFDFTTKEGHQIDVKTTGRKFYQIKMEQLMESKCPIWAFNFIHDEDSKIECNVYHIKRADILTLISNKVLPLNDKNEGCFDMHQDFLFELNSKKVS